MIKGDLCFFTVCGGGADYEFLLGSIEHHAQHGNHVVLDTAPMDRARQFNRLPKSVLWVHEPVYGSGWKEFRYVDALNRALGLCEQAFDPKALAQTDSDDFWIPGVFDEGRRAVVELQYGHWMPDGFPYVFGESEFHRRLFPAKSGIRYIEDPAWTSSRTYNGNPQTHPKLNLPDGMTVVQLDGLYRHHVHFALSEKASDDEIARGSITGWPHGGLRQARAAWPDKLAHWRDLGILPSSTFE